MKEQSISHNVPPRVAVIGAPVSAVTLETALAFAAAHPEALRGCYFCAANAHTAVMAREDPVYRSIQEEAALILPDGKPLSLVGRRKTDRPIEKVSGTHFMRGVFSGAAFAGKRHFFYGMEEKTLAAALKRLKTQYPDLVVCGEEASPFRELDSSEVDALARRINETAPDFIWVAIGAPRQERLMHRLQGKVHGLMVGIGGGLKVLTGLIPDAPRWMQQAGLEWLFRLAQEPGRLWKRYLVTNTKFIFYLLRENKHV